jgi:transcription initiation factor TFIIB
MDDIFNQFIPTKIVDDISQECTCSSCGELTRFTEDGFRVCSNSNCGTIITHVIDEAPEWRFYEESASNPTRCGLPINPLLPKSSFGCKIGRGGKLSYEMLRISRCNEWSSMPYSEIAKYNSFQYITLMANNAGISKMIVEEACAYHSQISEHQTFRGLNKDGIIAASIYIACRIQNIPRTAKEIARMFHLDSTSATKGCRNAMTIINELEQKKSNDIQLVYTSTTPSAFIDRYCSHLNMAKDYITLAKFVAMKIEKQNMIPEHTPNSVATGIIYLISNEFELNISKKDIQQVSDISEVTINKCFQTIEQLKQILIPPQAYTMFKSRT